MTDRAFLKRKLHELDKEQRVLQDSLWRIECELNHHRSMEMQLFLKKRFSRISKFYSDSPTRCKLDNGLRVLFEVNHKLLYVYDKGWEELGAFDVSYGIRLYDYSFNTWDLGSSRLTRLADVLPDLDRLVHVDLPAWHKASKELDVESLVISRTLRWISKQVGGQWPDIISGKFPLK